MTVEKFKRIVVCPDGDLRLLLTWEQFEVAVRYGCKRSIEDSRNGLVHKDHDPLPGSVAFHNNVYGAAGELLLSMLLGRGVVNWCGRTNEADADVGEIHEARASERASRKCHLILRRSDEKKPDHLFYLFYPNGKCSAGFWFRAPGYILAKDGFLPDILSVSPPGSTYEGKQHDGRGAEKCYWVKQSMLTRHDRSTLDARCERLDFVKDVPEVETSAGEEPDYLKNAPLPEEPPTGRGTMNTRGRGHEHHPGQLEGVARSCPSDP